MFLFAGLAGAAQGMLTALLVAHLIGNSTQYARLADRGVHSEDAIVGAISGAVIGVLLCAGGNHARVFIWSLWSRVGFVASAWPLMRLGMEQPVGWATAVFCLLGAWLATLGLVNIAALARQSRRDDIVKAGKPEARATNLSPRLACLSYGSAALAVVLMGVYLTGTRELLFERDARGEVSLRMSTHRWSATVLTQSQEADGVTGWRADDGANAVDILTTSGAVRVGGNRSFTNSLTAMVDKSLDAFLESGQKQLLLNEVTPRWSFRFYLLGASLVLVYGFSVDPILKMPDTAVLVAWGFAVISGFAALSSMLSMTNQFQQELSEARELLERAGGTVERTELRAREAVFYADGFRVQFTDSNFGDDQLKAISPALDLIGVSLDLSGTAVTDAAVGRLKHFQHVLMLDLRRTAVTNEVVLQLRDANLRYLDVRETAIDRRGLRRLEGSRLPFLLFSDSNFTDRDLEILYNIDGLEYAYIGGSRVTETGLDEWSEVLPDVELGP